VTVGLASSCTGQFSVVVVITKQAEEVPDTSMGATNLYKCWCNSIWF